MSSGRKATGPPVGSQGLTPVGSPNRIQRRTPAQQSPAPGLAQGDTPFHTPGQITPAVSAAGRSSTFAERVYQSTGGALGRSGSGEPAGPAAAKPKTPQTPVSVPKAAPAIAAAPKMAKGQPRPASTSAIPESVMDHPSQRIYALAVAGLLVAWKLYDAVAATVDSSGNLALFIKWCVLDAALWYAAWRLRIPRLSVGWRAMCGMLAASVFLDMNLFLLPANLLTLALRPLVLSVGGGCVRAVRGIPWLGVRLVGDSELLIDTFALDDEHILGRHTIHVLPHSLAHMNPQGRTFCVPADLSDTRSAPWRTLFGGLGAQTARTSQGLTIPILINGTRPAAIRYAFTPFATGERQVRTVTRVGSLAVDVGATYPALGAWVQATYRLPVRDEGAYELVDVRDANGLVFRMSADAPPTIIVRCPSAHLRWRQPLGTGLKLSKDGHASICQRNAGDTPSPLLEAVVEGYAPVDVAVARIVDGQREAVALDSAQPTEKTEASALAARWAPYRSTRVVHTIDDAFQRPGEYVYKLERARDAANHTVGLRDVADGGAAHMVRIQVHSRPAAAWASKLMRSEQPLRLSADAQRASRHVLPLALQGTSPWIVEYEVIVGDNVAHESQQFEVAADAALEATRPGTYRLLTVSDGHCKGGVDSSNVTIIRAVPPELRVSSEPIASRECAGAIGVQIALELRGRPPFVVHYREKNVKLGSVATRTVRTAQRSHTFAVTPERAGMYELDFFRVDDDDFPSGSAVDARVAQEVHAQPDVHLDRAAAPLPRAVCLGDAPHLPLRFRGLGPWQLQYRLVHDGERGPIETVTGIAEERYTVPLPKLDKPGDWAVELMQVADNNGCVRDVQRVVSSVRVRARGPQVAFACPPGGLHVLDGTPARMPVVISGAADEPAVIRYRLVDDGPELTARVSRATGAGLSIPASAPGTYELLAARDVCPGSIDTNAVRCVVHVEPRPHAWFIGEGLQHSDASSVWQAPSSCEGVASAPPLALGLRGVGPWRVEYRVDYWATENAHSGDVRHSDRSTTHTTVAMQNGALRAEPATAAGLYRYTLLAVADENYPKLHQLLLPGPDAPAAERLSSVEHLVTRGPNASLRAYLPDGTPADARNGRGLFGRGAQSPIRHCLAPGQSPRGAEDAQQWARVREKLPKFHVEFDAAAKPPLDAWVEVFPSNGPSEVVHVADIKSHSHAIELPARIAAQLGRYHVRLVRTQDARGCERRFVDPSEVGVGMADRHSGAIAGGIEVEYIEAPSARPAASSAAANPDRDVCLGDILAFDLRGLGAWTVDYRYNGMHRSAHANKRLFRRIADEPGNFTLTRVCHRSANDCCSEFTDLAYVVHDIPRVRVSGGKNVYQDILEGEKVDIRLDLVGTPPFTFTWQRRALVEGSSSKAGKVLESHTVKDLESFDYTISTSSEGTFEVTFIQDKHCQYPKA